MKSLNGLNASSVLDACLAVWPGKGFLRNESCYVIICEVPAHFRLLMIVFVLIFPHYWSWYLYLWCHLYN